VRLWDARTGQSKGVLAEHEDDVVSLAYSPDGRTLATASMDVRLWDAASGQLKATLKGHSKAAWALAFSPDGRTLASGSWDHTARLWDAERGELQAILRGHTDQVETLAFAPDGKTLATAGLDKSTRLWKVPGGEPIGNLQRNSEPIWRLLFSPDGQTLVTMGWHEVRLWNPESGRLSATLQTGQTPIRDLAFSRDGRTLATVTAFGRALLWDRGTGKAIPSTGQNPWSRFPPEVARPITDARAGAAILVHHPLDGRLLATLLPLPQVAAEVAAARPITIGARAAPVASEEWFVTTPEGYFDGSANGAGFIRWNVGGVLYPAERYLRRFRRPDLVRRALRGERITAPALSAREIPPAVDFIGLREGESVGGDRMPVTVEVRDDRDVKEVVLFLNGRPLPPERARPIRIGARPIRLGARPIRLGAREGNPAHRLARQLTFQVPLPLGTPEIRLRAVAYDDTDLGSDPVELVLRRADARPVAGRLHVLSVGVSRYRNADGSRIQNLQFAAADARAIAARFQREGGRGGGPTHSAASRPLYEQVHVSALTDDQATAAGVRAEIARLQERVRPGQIDTVVLFLSGHGISQDGRYFFATHELDPKNIGGTNLSGRELREALGGRLRAKAVFLFMDTCHAGGLRGRNDDLALEVGEGVFLLASSGAKGSSYESPSWGHGAFTLALLRALDRAELAREGVIHFNALTYAVPDEVAALMKEAGRNESEQEPCIPLAARRLRVPIVQAAR
jgi:hypothetical protein